MPDPRIRIYVPGWWLDSSGLILPSTARLHPALPARNVPPELRPQRQPVAFIRQQPNYTDQIAVYADESAAGLPISSLETLRALVRMLPFQPSIRGLSRLAGGVYAWREDRDAQLRMARNIFGAGPVLASLQSFLAEIGGRAVLFAEQHIFVLQRLLIDNARDEPREDLSEIEGAALSRALFGATALGASMTEEEEGSGSDMLAWLPYFIQNGAYNSRPMPIGELARAQELFVRLAHTAKIKASTHWCALDDWMTADYGLGIEDQFTLGFAMVAMSHGFETDETAGSNFVIPATNFDDLMTKLGWTESKIQAALSVISADRETFSREFKETGTSAHHFSWDVLPFMRHPFLRLADGSLVLLSARAMLSWLSDGFHYRLLDSAQRRAAAARSTKISRKYTALAGELLEVYALDLVRSVHPG